jgi:ATP-dependent exoDNAse (exonuclease V) alpha subunit
MEHGWQQGRDLLTTRDVLVIDEAGMVGTRQLERVLSHAAEAGTKVVLVGDPQQLQAIEAGAAFRSIHERHGGAEIGEVRRQREDWQRDATRDLANGKAGNALGAYRSHGMLREAQTREQARGDLIERWDRDRAAYGELPAGGGRVGDSRRRVIEHIDSGRLRRQQRSNAHHKTGNRQFYARIGMIFWSAPPLDAQNVAQSDINDFRFSNRSPRR